MVESDQSVAISLPDELRGQFDRLEKKLFRVETGLLAAGSLAGLAGSYLLVFASDRLWDSPPVLRAAIFAGGVVVIGYFSAAWLKRWVLRRRTQKDLATIVQTRFQRLGDRLLGIVELSSEQTHQHGFSPELYRAAIRQVAADAAPYDFTEAVPRHALKRARTIAIVTGAAALGAFILFPKAGLNALARLFPWSSTPRYTLVEINGLPQSLLVPHGEEFRIAGSVRYDSFWTPSHVAARFGRFLTGQGSVEAGNFSLTIPGRLEEGDLHVRVGDAERIVRVKPVLRPSLKNLAANVELPAYLKLPAREQSAQGGSLTVVEGSKAAFTGQVSRPLAQAETIDSAGASVSTKTDADKFTTAPVAVDNINFAEFRWRDQLGFTNQTPWKLAIQTQKDSSPIPELPDLSREISIIESEVLQIKVRARDDFGVQKVGLNWDLGTGATNQPYDFSAEAETFDRADFEQTFTFTPLLMAAQADTTIAVRGYAVDYFPGRESTETPSYRIHILGSEQHAEMVRQRLEAVMARLEEVSRLEEKIAAATAELQGNEKLSDEELSRKASELKEEQMQNAAALKDMAEEGMKNLREALKNPAFTEKLLSDWTKTMQEMQSVASKPMQDAAKSLGEAAKPQQGQQAKAQKEKSLADAQDKQKDILDKLQELQKKANKGLDDMQAMTLAQRLRKIGSGETDIHAELAKVINDTIGLRPEELSARDKKRNASLAEQQNETRDKSKDLQGEISRFFERTRKPAYGQVSKEMADIRAPEELDRVRGLIEGNISMQAMDSLALWATRFEGWADLLEPKKKDEGQSEGPPGEPGEEEEDNTLKQLMALLRVREGQVNLRERTRLLEKDHRDETFYKESAGKLREGESKLVDTLEVIQGENKEREMESVLRDTGRALKEVENLLAKPRTDQVTAVAHESALEKLTDAINMLNEKAKKNQQSGPPGESQSEEMAFLMKMMEQQNPQPGMQGGMKPGMNFNGGDTAMPAIAKGGDATGKRDANRAAKKAGGATASLPAEFREALEGYYKNLEKEAQ
jgi:hypothetical protein